MTKYDGYSDQCRYSPATEPDIPRGPKEGRPGSPNVRRGLSDNSNTQRSAPAGKIADPAWRPGRGTKSTGKSAQNID